ncbi:MAG: hypothetical protein DDT19_02129 [Syntrophomonadaceae bacterium]|nr:hypothetical protein [Bacillota bacterium]
MAQVRTGPEGTKYARLIIDACYQEDERSIHITSQDGVTRDGEGEYSRDRRVEA